MMKTLRVLIIIIVTGLMMSCALINDSGPYYIDSRIAITSDNVFSINGMVYNSVFKNVPFTVYNPNAYSISVNIDEIEYTINSHEELTINTP